MSTAQCPWTQQDTARHSATQCADSDRESDFFTRSRATTPALLLPPGYQAANSNCA